MDANTAELIFLSTPNVALNAALTLVQIPLTETLNIVEFGVFNAAGADNVAAGVLKLQAVDTTAGGATFTDLCILTGTAALVQGSTIFRRCDVLVDKLLNVAVGPGASGNTNGTINPSAGKQFIAVQLRITTGFTAATVGTGYVKVRKQGTGATSVSGETSVIA